MNKKLFSFPVLSSALMALAVVVSCTVTSGEGEGDGNGAGDCIAGRSVPCSCADDSRGTQVCNSSGTAYSACNCEAGGDAGATSSGGADGQAGATANGGDGSGYAGEAATAGAGGVASVAGGAGGAETVGGAGGQGAGGEPGLCDEPEDPCQECYFEKCCELLAACLGNNTCATEFTNVRDCSDAAVAADDLASPADVDACLQTEANDTGDWDSELTPQLVALVDCMNGADGWEGEGSWSDESCRDGCYVTQ